MDEERQKLIEQYDRTMGHKFPLYVNAFVDLLIAERKRVVEPLLVMNDPNFPKMTSNGQLNALWEAGTQTLTNAGVA